MAPAATPEAGGQGPETAGPAEPSPGLSTLERLTALLYGNLVVLTFTGAFRVAMQQGADLKTTLRAAVGCCLAWAIVDAAIFVLQRLAIRNRNVHLLRVLRDEPGSGPVVLREILPAFVVASLSEEQRTGVESALARIPVKEPLGLMPEDVRGAIGIFFLEMAGLLPIAAPFALMKDVHAAQVVSNGIALLLLFGIGLRLARETGESPLGVAFRFLGFGVALVGVTLALGG
jgi:hypothetical protein